MNKFRRMISSVVVVIALLVGILLGIIGGPGYILIVWGIVGLAIGVISLSAKRAILNGGVYGFAVAFVFMISGYEGVAPLVSRLAPFAVLGIFGALCGLILSIIGYRISSKIKKNES